MILNSVHSISQWRHSESAGRCWGHRKPASRSASLFAQVPA